MEDQFHPVSLDEMSRYKMLQQASGSRASDYSFVNLWGWAAHYGLEWRFNGSLCWIRQTLRKGLPTEQYWAPVGDWNRTDWQGVAELRQIDSFIRVPEELSSLWEKALPGKVLVEETRGSWDYLYKAAELSVLSGNRFHKKKNLLNQFLKLNPEYVYKTMTLDSVEAVLAMQEEWCAWRECIISPDLLAENNAIERVLRHWEELPGLTGGLIILGGKVVAYTVGEPLTDDTVVVHFEKGTTEFKGIYQAINCLFARQQEEKYIYLNREQDMDEPGLREAKESYNPVDFVRKNVVRIAAVI